MKITNNTTLKKAATLDGNHAAGRGLYLCVRGGSKRYVYRFFKDGKAHEVPIGTYADLSLAEARDKANVLRHARRVEKIDPRVAAKATPATVPTFRDDTKTYYEHKHRKWDADHARIWLGSMENHVWPRIGDRDTATLAVDDIVRVLKPLWLTAHETAIRVHGRVRVVIEHAMDTDDLNRFTNGNPADRAAEAATRGPQAGREGASGANVAGHPRTLSVLVRRLWAACVGPSFSVAVLHPTGGRSHRRQVGRDRGTLGAQCLACASRTDEGRQGARHPFEQGGMGFARHQSDRTMPAQTISYSQDGPVRRWTGSSSRSLARCTVTPCKFCFAMNSGPNGMCMVCEARSGHG